LEDLDKKELINIFDYLINNKDARKKMSIDGQKFIDGYGSKRVIDEMVV
jgi:ribosome assembly protein YihI (activator of Der GTPase)